MLQVESCIYHYLTHYSNLINPSQNALTYTGFAFSVSGFAFSMSRYQSFSISQSLILRDKITRRDLCEEWGRSHHFPSQTFLRNSREIFYFSIVVFMENKHLESRKIGISRGYFLNLLQAVRIGNKQQTRLFVDLFLSPVFMQKLDLAVSWILPHSSSLIHCHTTTFLNITLLSGFAMSAL